MAWKPSVFLQGVRGVRLRLLRDSIQGHFTFMAVGTLDEPSKLEVRKDGRAIGRILHVGAIFEFHPGMTSFALNAAAQYSDLEELKKWIRGDAVA